MKNILVLLILLTGFSVKAQQKDSVLTQPKPVATLDKKGYSIKIPDQWKIMDNCQENLCSLLSPVDTIGYFDVFIENINITVSDLPTKSYTVDQYSQYSIKYLPTVVKNFKIIDRKKLKPNVFRMTYQGEKNNFKQTWRQFYYVKAGKVYIVTFASETEKYDKYLPVIDPFLDSFKLK
jgi:hypothetical protein